MNKRKIFKNLVWHSLLIYVQKLDSIFYNKANNVVLDLSVHYQQKVQSLLQTEWHAFEYNHLLTSYL